MTDKWQNTDAGPRQVKDLNHAIGALTREGQGQDELTGVIGGNEWRSSVWSPFGGTRPEVTAADEAIRERYAYTVTRGNVRQIIADYEAATAEAAKSRPVVDNRRTAEEDATLTAERDARRAAELAEEQARGALVRQVIGKAPAGAKALIFAEYEEDNSDPMTDYYNSRTVRTVAIGYRHSSREDFRALHAVAGQFPETAHLATPGENEHRQNYSMGGGNFLSDHGGRHGGTGWVVRSADFPCAYVHLTEDAIPDQRAATGNGFYDQHGNWIPQRMTPGNAVTVSPSSLGRDGVIEIRFCDRPADDVLAELKARGFRWARGNRCWYGTDTDYAHQLTAV